MDIIRGRVWVFGDDVDTDAITPGIYMDAPVAEMIPHVLASLDVEFPEKVMQGDIIAAGSNFGCGSSRESAAEVLKQMNIGAIVARSFGRIFFRNAVALGIPVLTLDASPGCFSRGDNIEVDIEQARVRNITADTILEGVPLYTEVLAILRRGGIIPLMREMVQRGERRP